jgi:hypothetical protein
LFSYDGEQYRHLDAQSFDEEDMAFATKYLRILSGMYGLLRPMDAILPYRLEMNTPISVMRGRNLYEFWGNKVTISIAVTLQDRDENMRFIIDLASNEYSKCVRPAVLSFPKIRILFKEKKGERFQSVSVFAKQARGMMARYIIKNRITNPRKIKEFNEAGYSFNPELSERFKWIFTREQP